MEKFDILIHCLMSHSHVINYPQFKGNDGVGILDKSTGLLSVMTVCHHGIHKRVMVYMLNIGESTMQRIFVTWVVFMEAVFSKTNLKPDEGFLAYSMPELFIRTGNGLTDIVIDWTEFKLQQPL